MTLQRCLTLYLAFPVLLAFMNGVRGTVFAPEMSSLDTVLMFIGCGLPTYGFAALIAHLLLPLMTLLRLPSPFALVFSAIAAIPFSYFVIIMFVRLFGTFYPSLQPLLHETGFGLGDGFLLYVTGSSGLLIVPLWVGAHFIYEKITGDVLFFPGAPGMHEATEVSEPPETPEPPAPRVAPADPGAQASPFFNKMKLELGRKIVALEAQEHYVKVYTQKGEGLILYRFGDAVQEVAPSCPGLRVHRSYWVAENAVSEVISAKKSYKLLLSNGLEVPVSNSYSKVVEQYLVMNPDLHIQR